MNKKPFNLPLYSKDQIYIFLRKCIQKILKIQILTIHYFAYTRYYLLYVVVIILACFSKAESSYINLFFKYILFFTMFSTFIIFILLLLPFTKSRVEMLAGAQFIDAKLPGNLKGLLPFMLFLLTVSTLGLMEAFSLSSRVHYELDLLNMYDQRIEGFGNNTTIVESVESLGKTMENLSKLPKDFSSTRIITDISTWVCSLL